ncbi:MAG TPA: hypothetical protein VF183_04705 [Acidimicrobiales bacterium]
MAKSDSFCTVLKRGVEALRRLDYQAVKFHQAGTGAQVAHCVLRRHKAHGGERFYVKCEVPSALRRSCKSVGVKLAGARRRR